MLSNEIAHLEALVRRSPVLASTWLQRRLRVYTRKGGVSEEEMGLFKGGPKVQTTQFKYFIMNFSQAGTYLKKSYFNSSTGSKKWPAFLPLNYECWTLCISLEA